MVDRFVAGIVGAPFGVKGYVKVIVPSGEVSHLEDLRSAVLRKGGAERTCGVEDASGAPSSFVMKFKGFDSPEAAKVLTGSELVVDRADAAPLAEDEFYVEDLRGVAVTAGGAKVGEIRDVVEGGGGQLVEVALQGGGSALVPFRSEFFGKVDVAAGTAELLAPWVLE